MEGWGHKTGMERPRGCGWLRCIAAIGKQSLHFLHLEWTTLGSVLQQGKIGQKLKNNNPTGREIPIKNEDGDQLFPSVTIWDMALEANFGNDPAKPFKYDTTNCPGLELKAK
jgi:hypothetical protein